MRWRCAAGIFHRSAVFSRRTSALLHLTIWSPESDGASESHLGQEKQPAVPAAYLVKDPRFKPLWRWYELLFCACSFHSAHRGGDREMSPMSDSRHVEPRFGQAGCAKMCGRIYRYACLDGNWLKQPRSDTS